MRIPTPIPLVLAVALCGCPVITEDMVQQKSGSSMDTGDGLRSPFSEEAVLSNDGYFFGAQSYFMLGFTTNECWASTFEADPADYPIRLTGIQALIGGETELQTFTVNVWDVDSVGAPLQQISATGSVQLAGGASGYALDTETIKMIPFDSTVGMEPLLVESGRFAVVMCQPAHEGGPSIARDGDGTIQLNRNWIFDLNGWVESSNYGLLGDWVLRAAIEH